MRFFRFAAQGWALLSALALGAAGPVARESERAVDADHFDHVLLAREIFRVTNEIRGAHGAVALKPDPRLAQAADEQAALLSIRIHSGHDNPLPHQGDPSARVREAGLPEGTVAENAATLGVRDRETGRNYSYRQLAAVLVQAWMDSPGHRANLLNPALHYLGCGTRVARLLQDEVVVYAIQDFYTPAPRPPAPPPPVMQPGATGITH